MIRAGQGQRLTITLWNFSIETKYDVEQARRQVDPCVRSVTVVSHSDVHSTRQPVNFTLLLTLTARTRSITLSDSLEAHFDLYLQSLKSWRCAAL